MYRYQFNLEDPQFENTKIINEINNNKNYKKYNVEVKLQGEMIKSIDTRSDNFEKPKNLCYIEETYDEYLKISENIQPKNYKWIYNIIDGISEQEDIIYNDEKFILIPTYTWNKKNMAKIHILAIFKDKSLKTIRSLTGENIELLQYVLDKSFENIEKIYNIPKERFRAYFHYHPSTWQLHIHFNLLDNKNTNCLCEYSHEVNQVIFNLSICSDYYKKITMKRVFGEVD